MSTGDAKAEVNDLTLEGVMIGDENNGAASSFECSAPIKDNTNDHNPQAAPTRGGGVVKMVFLSSACMGLPLLRQCLCVN